MSEIKIKNCKYCSQVDSFTKGQTVKCIECKSNGLKEFTAKAIFCENYFIDKETALILQAEMNRAEKQHGSIEQYENKLDILQEEVNECEAELIKINSTLQQIKDYNINQDLTDSVLQNDYRNLKHELLQVACVAIRIADTIKLEE